MTFVPLSYKMYIPVFYILHLHKENICTGRVNFAININLNGMKPPPPPCSPFIHRNFNQFNIKLKIMKFS